MEQEKTIKSFQDQLEEKDRIIQGLEEQIAALKVAVNTDKLTGLTNRHFFEATVSEMAACAEKEPGENSNGGILVISLDLDKFKVVNDTFGHAAGDAVLQEFAKRLKGSIRSTALTVVGQDSRTTEFIRNLRSNPVVNCPDVAVRMGGEEFLILMPMYQCSLQTMKNIADRMLRKLYGPFNLNLPDVIHITASVGMQFFKWDELDTEHMLDGPDKLSYNAKDNGRAQIWLKNPESNNGACLIKEWHGKLSPAVLEARKEMGRRVSNNNHPALKVVSKGQLTLPI